MALGGNNIDAHNEVIRHNVEPDLFRAVAQINQINEEKNKKISDLTTELQKAKAFNEKLNADNTIISHERDRWKQEFGNLKTERDKLKEESCNLATERDRWKQEFGNLKTERDKLKEESCNLATERDRWKQEFGNLKTERDKLKEECCNLATERDRWKQEFGILKTDRDKLKEEFCNLVAERDEVKRETQNLMHRVNAKNTELTATNLELESRVKDLGSTISKQLADLEQINCKLQTEAKCKSDLTTKYELLVKFTKTLHLDVRDKVGVLRSGTPLDHTTYPTLDVELKAFETDYLAFCDEIANNMKLYTKIFTAINGYSRVAEHTSEIMSKTLFSTASSSLHSATPEVSVCSETTQIAEVGQLATISSFNEIPNTTMCTVASRDFRSPATGNHDLQEKHSSKMPAPAERMSTNFETITDLMATNTQRSNDSGVSTNSLPSTPQAPASVEMIVEDDIEILEVRLAQVICPASVIQSRSPIYSNHQEDTKRRSDTMNEFYCKACPYRPYKSEEKLKKHIRRMRMNIMYYSKNKRQERPIKNPSSYSSTNVTSTVETNRLEQPLPCGSDDLLQSENGPGSHDYFQPPPTPASTFSKCRLCDAWFTNKEELNQHRTMTHHLDCFQIPKSPATDPLFLMKSPSVAEKRSSPNCESHASDSSPIDYVRYFAGNRSERSDPASYILAGYITSFEKDRKDSKQTPGSRTPSSVEHILDSGRSNETQWYCSCGHKYKTQEKLNKHIIRVRTIYSPQRKHGCGICKKRFENRSQLVKHYQTHTRRYTTSFLPESETGFNALS